MNKNIIKNYAIKARDELIKNVQEKARYFGIYPDYIDNYKETDFIKERKREVFIKDIQLKGYTYVLEEIAYTIFNKIISLYFMEVNGYSPYDVLIFTNRDNQFDPEVLYSVEKLNISSLNNIDKSYINSLYYSNILIGIFYDLDEKIPTIFKDTMFYLDLVFPDNLLYDNSIIGCLVNDIDREYFKNDVEIIGWLYQYYNEEKKNSIINVLNQSPIKKEEIPAVTQIFTTDWIVRYLVDNSLGRYWLERNKNSTLRKHLEYFIDKDIEYKEEEIEPTDLTILDPCMGSGHILLYSIDVLLKIYNEKGYNNEEAILLILKNNIFGLDIDKRVHQLAYFSIVMKCLEYNKNILNMNDLLNVFVFKESNNISDDIISFIIEKEPNIEYDIKRLINLTTDALEIGSIVIPEDIDFNILESGLTRIINNQYNDILSENYKKVIINNIIPLMNQIKILKNKYKIVITNPPYLNKYSSRLKEYVYTNYNKYSADLYEVFMRRNFDLCVKDGYLGFVTPNVWMFVKTYENIRRFILNKKRISSLVQIGKGSFYKEAIVDICTFVLQNTHNDKEGYYIRLEDFKKDMDSQNIKYLEIINNESQCLYTVKPDIFNKIPSTPIAYWVNDKVLNCFYVGKPLHEYAVPRQGLATGCNDYFVKFWYEVDFEDIFINSRSIQLFHKSKKLFAPYNKGGEYCKWYGNNQLVILFDKPHYDQLLKIGNHLPSRNYYFKESITWSKVSSGKISFRYKPFGNVFDVAGTSIFMNEFEKNNDLLYYILGLNNSIITSKLLEAISPTMNFEVGQISSLPIIISNKYKKEVISLVKENINLCKTMYDSNETSWDFLEHPFIRFKEYKAGKCLISDAYKLWEEFSLNNYTKLKNNEERINEIFLDIYKIDDIDYKILDHEMTIEKANIIKDVKSFLSYLVGIIFGRYSLNKKGLTPKEEGLIKDNILVLTKLDYNNDITILIKKLLIDIFGEESLEENLHFISSSIANKEKDPLEAIRQYFICDFYNDHYKMYKKTPIYWLIDTGKKKSFRALCYYHKFNYETVSKTNDDYLNKALEYYTNIYNKRKETLTFLDSVSKYVLKKKIHINKEQILEIERFKRLMGSYNERIDICINDGVKTNREKFWKVFSK